MSIALGTIYNGFQHGLPNEFVYETNKIPSWLIKAIVTNAEVDYIGSFTVPQILFTSGVVLSGQQAVFVKKPKKSNEPENSNIITYFINNAGEKNVFRTNGGAANRIQTGDEIVITMPVIKNGKSATLQLDFSNGKLEISQEKINEIQALYENSTLPMYAGKIHRAKASLATDELTKKYQREISQHDGTSIIISSDIAKRAGFKTGDLVDYLPVYKANRNTVRVIVDDSSNGIIALAGKEAKSIINSEIATASKDVIGKRNENLVVLIKYKLMEYEKAKEYAKEIEKSGYPNLVVIDDTKKENVIDENCSSKPDSKTHLSKNYADKQLLP